MLPSALVSVFAIAAIASAQELAKGELHTWSFDAPTIELGYTVSTPDDHFHVGVLPGVLKGETDVTIKVFDHVDYIEEKIFRVGATAVDEQESSRLQVDWNVPDGMQIVTPIYEFDIKGAADLYDPSLPLWLRVHYPAATQVNRGVYFWDKGRQEWVAIPTTDHKADQSLRAAIHLTYAPMAVLSEIIPTEGEASWYRYHNCNCAASRHYPPGTLLEVTDLHTEKSVIIEVNDYGPEEWTGRIIDLDLFAFEQLTEKWRGLTQVRVVPYLMDETTFENEGLPNLYGVQTEDSL